MSEPGAPEPVVARVVTVMVTGGVPLPPAAPARPAPPPPPGSAAPSTPVIATSLAPTPWVVPRPVRPAEGGAGLAALAGVAAGAGLVLSALAIASLSTLRTLAPGLAGDGSSALPGAAAWVAVVMVVAVVAALARGRVYLRGAVARAETGSVRALLGPAGSAEPGFAVAPARRSVTAAASMAAAGALAGGLGTILLAVGPARDAAVVGAWLALVGGALVAGAGAMLPSILRAIDRRIVAASLAKDGGTVLMPPARSAWALPGVTIGILLLASAPFAVPGAGADSVACRAGDGWSCAVLRVPADHVITDPRPPTMSFAYAVHPADPGIDVPRRVLVIAVGGPGAPGVVDGDWMLQQLGDRVTRRFDVVIYDPRGTGSSDSRDCPRAADAYFATEETLTATMARTFADDCVREAGAVPSELGRYSTAQVAEDIDDVRAALGVERITLYGVSYGTVVAQVYAAAHPDRVEGLVLDAPLDRAVSGAEVWTVAAKGFERSLDQTLVACREDDWCSDALPDPKRAWTRLLGRLENGAILEGEVRDGAGEAFRATLSREQLGELVNAAMYDDGSRMELLRALARFDRGDPGGLLRLSWAWSGDTGHSTFAYFATWCADTRASPSTATDDFAAFQDVAREAGVTAPIYRTIASTLAPCLYWPAQPASWTAPAEASTVPTLILSATADPITPVTEARAILVRHPEARLVETRGGNHGSLGETCPMTHLEAFLVNGRLPDARSTTCLGDILEPFWPIAASPASSADDAVSGLYWELFADPLVMLWSGDRELRIGCADGGTAVFGPLDGWTADVELDECSYATGGAFSGSGTMNFSRYAADLELRSERGSVTLHGDSSRWRVDGTWDGKKVLVDE